MCSLFGLIDYAHTLSAKQKNRIITVLSRECEVRGTDATGIAYNDPYALRIFKRPLPAHRMPFRIPDVSAIMGHTRMTTQGAAKHNYNNHPFQGHCGALPFALAHNGVLYNDKLLRSSEHLPPTNIETDSYIAVQLLEQEQTLYPDGLRNMAEQMEGSFCFTVLDRQDNWYAVKGDNPLCLYHFQRGFYLYASTEAILKAAIRKLGLRIPYTAIPMECGEIVRIDPRGILTRSRFDASNLNRWEYPLWWRRVYPKEEAPSEDLLTCAASMGISREEVELLLTCGYDEDDIEELLYDPESLWACLGEVYEEMALR